MKNVPENELFSAYLDGELTAAEQAAVEQTLNNSPAARQLLEELRALSTTLQALPPQKLGKDLGPQVLREAERRMLAGPSAAGENSLDAAARPSPWRAGGASAGQAANVGLAGGCFDGRLAAEFFVSPARGAGGPRFHAEGRGDRAARGNAGIDSLHRTFRTTDAGS